VADEFVVVEPDSAYTFGVLETFTGTRAGRAGPLTVITVGTGDATTVPGEDVILSGTGDVADRPGRCTFTGAAATGTGTSAGVLPTVP